MKSNLIKTAIICVSMVLSFVSCSEKEGPAENLYLDVNLTNLAGTWELVSYSNGIEIDADTHVVLELIKKDCKYTLSSNIDSAFDDVETGVFSLSEHIKYGTIIRGMKDFSLGEEWNHIYAITKLTRDTMEWTALDETGLSTTNISVYRRVK